jgi:hypothetical protein
VECERKKRNVSGKTDEWNKLKKESRVNDINAFRTSNFSGGEEMSVQQL